jgi:hypothetical protein
MRGRKSVGGLSRELDRLPHPHCLERRAIDQLRDQVAVAHVVDGDDVGMAQRHQAIEPRVEGLVNLPTPPAPSCASMRYGPIIAPVSSIAILYHHEASKR